ncbi:putative immunoglobulin-blocking virulence protein [Mycoplasma sp. 2045]|uniref:putative immunoglobulin-blocking virulence protein n=1 Tax=Mycoplasma sp. 2045 TaxID=2967301 RepID=UPI00211C68CB|nr:putative immunoglobulin-blocking virulence protein [Mycoplasma sp. 2045]UUM20630.1 putative immunoglobulin-blocking virulence protein [Mycoplasma sp. 2045]
MIKAKRKKIIINIGAVSALAVVGVVAAKTISDNAKPKTKDLGVITQSRGIATVINENDVLYSDRNSSNKDNNLKIKVKIEPEQPTVENPKPVQPEPTKPVTEPEQPEQPEQPVNPEPDPVEPVPDPEPANPDPVEPEPTDPAPAPDPEPVTPTPGSDPQPEPDPAPTPEQPKEPEPEDPDKAEDSVYTEQPKTTEPEPEQPTEPIIEQPIIVTPPEPEPEPEPDPSTEPSKAIEGYANPEAAKDLDFATMKPKPIDKVTKVKEEMKREIRENLSVINSIFNKNPNDLTEADKELLNKSIIKIANNNPQINYPENADFSYLFKLLKDPQQAYAFKITLENINRELENYLNKGMVPSFHWGDTGFGSFAHVNLEDNVVRNEYIARHKNSYFAYESQYHRNSKQIRNFEYDGFSKQNKTSEYSRYGAGADKGIEIYEYKPESAIAKEKVKTNKVMAILDAANTKGYNSFLSFLDKVKKANKQIDVLVIKNMGLKDKRQEFRHILKQLPESIQKLTLFFEGKDTTSLIALKDKRIQELDLYSSNDLLSKDWGIDPIALRGVKNITFDYTFAAMQDNTNMPGSIVFNRLRFDKDDTLEEINEGLDIAFKDRYNERIFQGEFGDGSWPTWLDFSLNKNIRSLEGMRFHNRVFKNLTLYNNTNTFTVNADTLAAQQWSAMLIKGPERPKLHFVSPVEVNTLYIQGNARDLDDNWGPELYGLIESGKNVFRTIYVDNQTMADRLNRSQAFTKFGKTAVVKSANFDPSGGGDAEISFS